MRRFLWLLLPLFTPLVSAGQGRTITGKVVDEGGFNLLPYVNILDRDTLLLGTTDLKGNFAIQLPIGADELLLRTIGLEDTSLKVPANCTKLEIIMLADFTYDFMTIRKVNRKRYRRFQALANKHRQVAEKGVFTSPAPCFTYRFHEY